MFGIDMPSLFASQLGPYLLPLQLVQRTAGAPDPSDPSAGPVYTSATYQCQGFVEFANVTSVDGEITRAIVGDGLILLATLSTLGIVPRADDVVRGIDPNSGLLLDGVLSNVRGDPAGVQVQFSIKA